MLPFCRKIKSDNAATMPVRSRELTNNEAVDIEISPSGEIRTDKKFKQIKDFNLLPAVKTAGY
ncbi:hypothetical protein AGMMS49959_03000 [Planctomycetales bacterium]|nr:hypothetical protein AGMMS49959_03000 [Planctomycetales bacterium]